VGARQVAAAAAVLHWRPGAWCGQQPWRRGGGLRPASRPPNQPPATIPPPACLPAPPPAAVAWSSAPAQPAESHRVAAPASCPWCHGEPSVNRGGVGLLACARADWTHAAQCEALGSRCRPCNDPPESRGAVSGCMCWPSCGTPAPGTTYRNQPRPHLLQARMQVLGQSAASSGLPRAVYTAPAGPVYARLPRRVSDSKTEPAANALLHTVNRQNSSPGLAPAEEPPRRAAALQTRGFRGSSPGDTLQSGSDTLPPDTTHEPAATRSTLQQCTHGQLAGAPAGRAAASTCWW
jgi:hypothetical protein